MPFITFGLQKAVVDDKAKDLVYDTLAKQFESLNKEKFVIHEVYRAYSTYDEEWIKTHLDDGLIIILSVIGDDRYKDGELLHWNVFNHPTGKPDFKGITFLDEQHRGRLDLVLRIDGGDKEYKKCQLWRCL